jgi:glycosyltransferase involved in cell wall biosynthesis
MRIGIDARFAVHDRRGIGQYVLSLVTNLALLDEVNQYILYIDGADAERVLPNKSNMLVKILQPSNYFLWEQVVLPIRVLRDNIDVLHCTGNTAPVFLCNKTKLVITVHDIMYLKKYSEVPKSPVLHQRLGRWYRKMIVPRAMRNAAKVITVSNYSLSDIKKSIPALKEHMIAVTYNATQEIFGRPDVIDVDGTRKKYNICKEYILTVGGTDPRKNLEFTIVNYLKMKTAGKIKENLVVVGVHNWKQSQCYRLVQAANCAGDVVFMDFVADKELAALYKGAKAVLYLSLYEGFGIPPLEAMTSGVPVITSHTTSIPEIVGNAALMIDPTDEKAFEAALTGLLNDENMRKDLIRRGLEQAKRFSWKKTAGETLEIYESLLR